MDYGLACKTLLPREADIELMADGSVVVLMER